MPHSYEEIQRVTVELLREPGSTRITQYLGLKSAVADAFVKMEETVTVSSNREDEELFREIFWDLFRQGVITLGSNESNPEFPFFKISSFGRRLLENPGVYFFHDVSSYERVITESIPDVDELTLLYLKEAMQAFRSGCILSSSVMLGVATEHTFLKLLEEIENNPHYNSTYRNVFTEKTILRKFNKFRRILEQEQEDIPQSIKEDLETNLAGILSIIRNFRNDSGHPTGNIISREQCYILLNLFIPYCKKVYKLIEHFQSE